MSFFKLSFMNLKQNLKNYGMYIFSMLFSIIVFYNFMTLMFSKQFTQIQDLATISSVSGMCIFVLFIFFVFFISYSSSFFIEQRKKEFGIYTFMGVENNKIALLFAQEGLLIGLISLVGGLIGGVLVNKVFLMTLVKISKLSVVMKFEVSKESLITTAIVFIGILLFVFIIEYIKLLRTDISKLINATNIYQSDNSKNKTLQGLLGVIIIAFAYIVILKYTKLSIPFPVAIILTVIMVIVGTMFLFKGFFTFIISKIIKNKKILYNGTNILSFNNIIFRIRDNNKTLAQVAVLITCCLTSIIVSITMKSLFTQGKEAEYPYSMTYISNSNDDIVDKAIKISKEEIKYKLSAEFIPYSISSNSKEKIPYIDDVWIMKYSDVENISKFRKLENEDKLLKRELKDNEAFFAIPGALINAFDFKVNLNIAGKNVKIVDAHTLNLFGRFNEGAVLIVNDDDYRYFSEKLSDAKISQVKAITLENFDNTSKISEYIKNSSDIEVYSVDNFDENSYNFINSIYFMGLFMSLVFVVSVGSIMYFKCISDASKDKKRFDTLRKIGTGQEYINKVIFKQVGIFFLLPILIAIVHSSVAGYAISKLFNQDGRLVILVTVVAFSIIYSAYYLITAKKYIDITK